VKLSQALQVAPNKLLKVLPWHTKIQKKRGATVGKGASGL